MRSQGCPAPLSCLLPLLAAAQPLPLPLPPAPPGSEKNCCPVNWVEHEGSCYWFSRTAKPWPEAKKYCQLENGHLVVVGSWEEQVRARGAPRGASLFYGEVTILLSPQRFVQHHMGPVNTWMGLTDQDGPWRWIDGSDYEKGFQ